VERGERCTPVYHRDDLVVYDDGLAEMLPTMNDAMADRNNLLKVFERPLLGIEKGGKHRPDGFMMVPEMDGDDLFVLIKSMLVKGVVRTDLLAQALVDKLLRVFVDQLVFE
jgi:hypothetical protein